MFKYIVGNILYIKFSETHLDFYFSEQSGKDIIIDEQMKKEDD